VLCTCSIGLSLISLSHAPSVWTIYALLAAVGRPRAISGPAGQALLPNLVRAEHFPNAVAWSSTIWHVATVAGPALGGLVYAAAGRATEVYVSAAALELGALLSLGLMRLKSTPRAASPASWHELLAGLRYVRRNPLILGSISLDMFAVLLGGAVALLPIYARDILHVGPTGLGMLRSAPALGATLTAIVLAYRPLHRRAGAWLFACVGIFGVATLVFGASTSFVLSLGALVVTGASDMVSIFVRHTVVQLTTPDAMRGRVSAVNLVFIGASNELGEFRSGLTAAWFGTVPAVLLGGLGTCAVVALWAVIFPTLRRVDRLDERSLAAAAR
jgi:MFS family permease